MTKRCPITYLEIKNNASYHSSGLKMLAPKLQSLAPLPFSAKELRIEAMKHADKLSIQGVQYKLSAKLNIKEGRFDIVDKSGKYILKPQSDVYEQLPENEDLSMRLAKIIGVEVPIHGLIYNKDKSYTYFIKRFDRIHHKDKLAVEDFTQLSNKDRNTKYESSMENVAKLIDKYCSFPAVEKRKLFVRVLFNFIIGNEDMHLKNFALITRDGKIELAPAFDFVNSTIALHNAKEEIALPLNVKKRNLSKNDFVNYYAKEKLRLNNTTINEILKNIETRAKLWPDVIKCSFLNEPLKEAYLALIQQRIVIAFTP